MSDIISVTSKEEFPVTALIGRSNLIGRVKVILNMTSYRVVLDLYVGNIRKGED
jgi:hypothetical protein